ncbi:MAG: hypothetical protein LBJ00_06410 [Planctomycetaceae bacterium]|jgi:endonuclease-3|nr:hypothetical protein [Planctomycetaceae bacterium]
MSTISKTKKIETLQRALHRRYKWQSELPERTVLEHLVYSALLENAPAESATTAYEVLESYFIDWNEVRVTTTPELAEIITTLPDPTGAAERVRKALRGVFEKTYMFNLEELRKKGKSLSQAISFLKSLGTLSSFMADYVTQFALGGHVIPVDESTMRVFRMLDLAHVNKERTEEYVPGIERAVSKKNGIIFTMELHNFAYLLRTALDSGQGANEYLSVLKNIDPQAPTRNYTPPALTVPKPQKERKIVPTSVSIPFAVTADDDDFDEEHNGAEVEFLPSGLCGGSDLDGKYPAGKIKVKPKNKKKNPNEKPTSPQPEKDKPTPLKIQTIAPEKNTEPKTTTDTIDKAVKDKTKDKNKDRGSNVAVSAEVTSVIQNADNKDKHKNEDKNNNSASKDSESAKTNQTTQKKIVTKNNTTAVRNNSRQIQKNAVAKSQKTDRNKSRQKTDKTKNISKKDPDQAKLQKTTKDEKRQNTPPQKLNNKQKESKNNVKKIVKIIKKESKSVTKQLQKKRPK